MSNMLSYRMKVEEIEKKFFFLIIFLIPFTDTKFLPLPGEFKTDLALNISLLTIILHIFISIGRNIYNFKVNTALSVLYLFFIWIIISDLFNIDTIMGNYYKGRVGMVKVLWQYFIIVFLGFFFTNYLLVLFSKLDFKSLLFRIRKVILASYLIVLIYVILEYFLTLTDSELISTLLNAVDDILLIRNHSGSMGRLSSVMAEPPFLAMYLVFSAPWMMSFMYDKKYLLAFSPIIIGFLSGSRTALIISIVQTIVFILYYVKSKYGLIKIFQGLIITSVFIIVSYIAFFNTVNTYIESKVNLYSTSKISDSQISNISRFGTQVASLKIWKDNPIFGVGYSQQGFFLPDYYSSSDYNKSWEIRIWSDDKDPIWPTGFSLYTRLLAETGLFGFLIIIVFLFMVVRYSYLSLNKTNKDYEMFAIILFVSNISFILNYFQFDSFRLVSFWITIALTITMYNKIKSEI